MTSFAREANPRLVAAEIFSAAVCNLQCSYCYIPKNQAMIQHHNKLVQALRDNTYIKILKDTYGEDLENLGLWGTEPTLIIHELQPRIEDFLKEFPKLYSIGFSSNFVSNTNRIIDFIKHLDNVTDREIHISFQASLDGPFWITDEGRGNGVTEKIIKNVKNMFEDLKTLDIKNVILSFGFKATVGIEHIDIMVNNEEKIIEWYKFFSDLDDIIKNDLKDIKTVKINSWGFATPTLVVPGKYTSKDGKILQKFYEKLRILNQRIYNGDLKIFSTNPRTLNEYVLRLEEAIQNIDLLSFAPENLTCSAFDTQAGIDSDGTIMACHRTFLFNDDEYIKAVMKSDINEWGVSNMSSGILNNMKKHLMPNVKNEKEVAKYMYVSRGYHDFTTFRFTTTFNMIKELAAIGQASEIYLENDDLTFMLSMFLHTKMSCPAENYINTGSLHLVPVSLIRIFANGAFEEIFKEYLELQKRSGAKI